MVDVSPAERLLLRDDGTLRPRSEWIPMLRGYTDQEIDALARDWRFWARPSQLEPAGDWTLWAVIMGRGAGKTRSGAEFIIDRSEQFAEQGAKHRGGLIARTAADVRDVMIEGESGLIACGERRGYRVKYEPSKRRVTLPDLDTLLTGFTAEKPDQVRGHQFHTAWADESAAWRLIADREGNTAWSNLMLALRLEGELPSDWWNEEDAELLDELGILLPVVPEALQPRCIVTTTPKPIPLVQEWVKRATNHDPSIVLTTGSMLANKAHLAPRFVAEITARYGGTRLGAQEIEGLVLDSVEGALWTPELIDQWRWKGDKPETTKDYALSVFGRRVVAVDPSGSGHGHGDDCGIVVVGVEHDPDDVLRRHTAIFDDQSSSERPEVWARIACDLYHRYDCVALVAETNFGAALVADVVKLTDPTVRFEEVRASKAKRPRAEPVALLYDQGRAHHIGYFGMLEAEQCTWVPDEDMDSPNRMDAAVWGHHFLMPEISRPPSSQTSAAQVRIPTGAAAMARGRGQGLEGFAGMGNQ